MQYHSSIEEIFRLKEDQKRALGRIGLKTAGDLLYYFPSRYGEPVEIKPITELTTGEKATICGKIIKAKTGKAYRKKIPLTEAVIEDNTGKIKATWFHQPYIANIISKANWGCFTGKITIGKNGLYLANPDFSKEQPTEIKEGLFGDSPNQEIAPVYSETRPLSSKWFHHKILKLLNDGLHKNIPDPIPAEILKKYNLPSLETALVWIHNPKTINNHLAARKRFAFEEIFFIQLAHLKARANRDNNPSFIINTNSKIIDDFLKRFPFDPTSAQKNAIKQIMEDFKKDKPMARLLEGDVGSGKTAVAATVAYAAVESGYQVAYMAPTEILAKQHFENFIEYFKHTGLQAGLMTSSECRKFPSKVGYEKHTRISKSQLLKWLESVEISIIIGTHSLIQEKVRFSAQKSNKAGKNLALVIIDEQHRFGTKQRAKLAKKKESVPHLLSMTATPIPRTLALTIYSDLDLTLLDEMPKGRKPIITEIIPRDKRGEAYEKIREELKKGRQVYVICPKIEEGDGKLEVKNVTDESKRLKKEIFPEFEIGVIHGKLKPKEKDDIMQKFLNKEIDILVATSVIEVGVNVPNATLIVIEGAERFGLAQLHQLRGRVIRSDHQAYCFVFTDSKSENTLNRLKAFKNAKNGFELAELDLQLRGPGELGGAKQWGISDLGMEAIKNIKMVEVARTESQKIIKNDPELKNHPLVANRLLNQKVEVHFE